MDDIGNIVYVIGVVGYLIYRAVGGGKKKPANQQPSPAPKQKGNTIEDILKDLNQQLSPESPKRKAKPQHVEARPIRSTERTRPHKGHVHDEKPFLDVDNPHRELSADYRMSTSEMGSHRTRRKAIKHDELEVENSLSGYINELDEVMNLRKAVIYQAILETPYIQRV